MSKRVTVPEKTEAFDPIDTLIQVLENAPVGQGLTFAKMRKRIRIIDAVKEAQDKGAAAFDLEDADYNSLKEILDEFNGFLGGKNMKDIVALHDAVLAAKKTPKSDTDNE